MLGNALDARRLIAVRIPLKLSRHIEKQSTEHGRIRC
jgi:hypothetical protein